MKIFSNIHYCEELDLTESRLHHKISVEGPPKGVIDMHATYSMSNFELFTLEYIELAEEISQLITLQ